MTSRGIKILSSLKQSKRGRTGKEITRLLTAFGFEARKTKKYDWFTHPDYPERLDLKYNLTRSSGELAIGWVAKAVKVVERLLELQKESNNE